MEASYNEQWIKVLKEAKKDQNPFLSEIAKWNELDAQIAKFESELKTLKDKGYSSLGIWKRFEKAGMIDEYRSIYNFLCCDAHSNIRALINRHIETKKNDFSVIFYKDMPIENNLPTLSTTAGILVEGSGMIHEFFKTGLEDEINKYCERLQKIRNKVLST